MIAGEKIGAVVAAGGIGKRMGGSRAKQFLELLGKPLLIRTLEALQASAAIDTVVVAAPEDAVEDARRLILQAGLDKVVSVGPGGETRQESVWKALRELKRHDPALVLVQDAVRPFLDDRLILRVIEAARSCGGAVPAIPIADTIKVAGPDGMVVETPDRQRLWSVQTPQGFRFPLLWRAFESAVEQGFVGTDDSSLVERIGGRVKVVEGDEENIKITTPADLEAAERIVRRRTRDS